MDPGGRRRDHRHAEFGATVKICWTATGNMEEHTRIGDNLNGRWNDSEVVAGTKIG